MEVERARKWQLPREGRRLLELTREVHAIIGAYETSEVILIVKKVRMPSSWEK